MKKKIWIILFIILSVLFLYKSYNIINKVINYSNHNEYLKKPADQQQIEDWMTLNYIKRRFNIDLQEKL